MRSGYAAIINEYEQEEKQEVTEQVQENVTQKEQEETTSSDFWTDTITMKQGKIQETKPKIINEDNVKQHNSSDTPKTQHESSIITMLFGYISSVIINVIWVIRFSQGGYFSMTPEYNGRFLNESSRLFNITGSLFLSLVVMAAISGITGFLFSILIQKFKLTKKHMIVYAVMLALLFYIDIMYIGINCQNVYH